MSVLHTEIIKNIAREIAKGNTCYIHRFSKAITTIDNSIDDPEEIAAQEKLQAERERKIKDYVKIEKPSTDDQLVMMGDFIDEFSDKSVRKQLSNALNRKNPVRNFMQTVEHDMELNIRWRNYRIEEYQRWVSNLIIDAYNF